MSETEEKYGSLLFFRKDGKPGTSYPLSLGKICIGQSTDADIRLKLKDERLEEIHCIIDVTDNGIATILNKSSAAPVKVNTKPVRSFKVLCNKDKIDLVGKQFEYLNNTLLKQDIEKHETVLRNILKSSPKKRQSVAPVIKVQKNPNFKTKVSTQKRPLLRKSLNRNHTSASTPESKLDRNSTIEKAKTTSKLIASKALGSPVRTKTRRLSWDNNSSIIHKQPKVSARNILLSERFANNSSDGESIPSLYSLKDESEDESLVKAEKKVTNKTRLSNKTPNKAAHKTPIKTPKPVTPLSKLGKLNVTPGKSSTTKNKLKTPKNTSKKSSTALLTPATAEASTPVHNDLNIAGTSAGSSTGNKLKTPLSTLVNSSGVSKLLSTPVTIKTPKITSSNKLTVSNSKTRSVPRNKRLELLKGTPTSTKKSIPMEATPKRPNVEKKNDLSSTSKKKSKRNQTESGSAELSSKRSKSVENLALLTIPTSKRRKTEGQPSKDVFDENILKNPSSLGRKSNVASVGSDNLSEGSETLNLSVGSLISPIPRKTLCSTDSDVYESRILNDPRLSLGKVSPRKSLRKSQQMAPQKEGVSSESSENSSNKQNSITPKLSTSKNKTEIKESGDSSDSGSETFDLVEIYSDNLNNSKSRLSLKQNEENKASMSLRKSVTENKTRSSEKGKYSVDLDSSTDELWRNNGIDQADQDSSESFMSSFEEMYENMHKDLKSLKQVPSSSKSRLSTKNNVKSNKEEEIEQSSSESSEVANLLRKEAKNEASLHYSITPRLSRLETSDILEFMNSSTSSSKKRRSLRTNTKQDGRESRESAKKLSVSSRRSTRNIGEWDSQISPDSPQELPKEDSPSKDESNNKSIFVPQRRPPINRSYLSGDKDLLIRLSKSDTLQNDNLKDDTESNEENNSLNSLSPKSPRRSSRRKSTSSFCKSCGVSPLKSPSHCNSSVRSSPKGDSDTSIFNQTASSESFSTVDNLTEEYSSGSKKTSESQSDEELPESEPLDTSSKSNRSLNKRATSNSTCKTPIVIYDSIITIDDDTMKCTPENNTSIIILDTPYENTHKIPRRKPSKTLNSSFEDDSEITTPKSAIKSRRSKSQLYQPLVEDVTPVTPQEPSGEEARSGFKTPVNTPGLFENIKKSVLKTRSRRRSSNNLMEALNKGEPKGTSKRLRESSGSSTKLAKKRKVGDRISMESFDEDLDASFSSFASDEVFPDMGDQGTAPNTPQDFKNLTDKPLITDPQLRSFTEPKKKKIGHNRLSLHAMRLESHFSENDRLTDATNTPSQPSSSTYDNDVISTSTESRRSSSRLSLKAQNSPMSDVTNVQSPKNDLTDVRGVKRLLKTPRAVSSPKNDLRNIIGVKKLLATPKPLNSPKNDLRKVPNLRRLVYQVRENSPKNDLTNVAGVKKLLGSPQVVKSPKNDLRNVLNLRRMMSPKPQNSPKNDLSDVAGLKRLLSSPRKQNEPRNDLTNVAGVKKLLSTPKKQRSPKNDLTKVPNLEKWTSPKAQNSPRNDLSDVEGVADIFAVPEVHDNENLFDKLFDKKPIRTYRGRSLSPISRKTVLYGGDQRKTLGDPPCSSPRVKKWLEDQAVIQLERVDDRDALNTKENLKVAAENKHLNKTSCQEDTFASPRTVRRRQKKVAEQTEINSPTVKEEIDSTKTTSQFKSPLPAKRGRARKVSTKEDTMAQIAEVHSTTEDTEPVVVRRGRRRKASTSDEIESSDNEAIPATRLRSRTRTVAQVDSTEKKPAKRGRKPSAHAESQSTDTDAEVLPKKPARRGRKPSTKDEIEDVHVNDVKVGVLPKRRGKQQTVSEDNSFDSTGKIYNTRKVQEEEDVVEDIPNTVFAKQQHRKRSMSCSEIMNLVDHKPARGRKVQKKDEDKSSDVEVKVLPKRRGRARSASSDARAIHIDKITTKHEIMDVKTEAEPQHEEATEIVAEPVVSTEPKRTRGRRAPKQKESEDSAEKKNETKKDSRKRTAKVVLEQIPESMKKNSKSNKVIEDSEESSMDDTKSKEAIEIEKKKTPVRRANRKKAVENTEVVELPEETVPEKKTDPKKKPTKSNSSPKEKEPPTKRGRRKIAVDEPAEETTNGDDKENVEEHVPQSRTRKKKELAIKKIEEMSVESPRTRQRKGNFKKYGTDFLTEADDDQTTKKVRFQESEEKASGKNKRGEKATDEVEETVRRSKRTRK